jgi:site-specific recombinase
MDAARADRNIAALSLVGVTPLYAALTGVLLWLSSLVAGFTDNWFALRKLREALTHQRQLVRMLGAGRAERLAGWLDRNIAVIAGNLALGVLLGMTPVLAQFFGVPADVRQVTLSAGSLVAAAASLGWPVLATPAFWLAAAGVAVTALLNVGIAFGCALALALRAREAPRRIRRLVFRSVIRRFMLAPHGFLFPPGAPRVNEADTKAGRVAAPAADGNAQREAAANDSSLKQRK